MKKQCAIEACRKARQEEETDSEEDKESPHFMEKAQG